MSSADIDEWNPPDSVLGKIKYVILAVGPMAVLMSASMGPGTISSLTIGGSQLGYSALWLVLISGWLGAAVYFVGGKVTAITNETPVDLINRYTHPVFTYALLLTLLYAWYYVVAVQGNVLGAATAVLVPPLEPYIAVAVVPALVLLIALIFVSGFDLVKALLSVFTLFMAAIFVINAFIVSPDFSQLSTGLVPELLQGSAGRTAFAGILGGSVGIGPIWYAYLAHDNGWGREQLRFMAWDQIVFYGILFTLFSVGIYISAAATLQGIAVEGALDAATSLEPTAGGFAAFVFTVGLWTSAFTTLGGMTAVAAYLVADLVNHLPFSDVRVPLTMDDRRFKAILVVGVLTGIIGPFLDRLPALPLMTYAISLFNVIAPTTILIFAIAVLREEDVGGLTGPWYLIVGLAAAFVITLYAAYGTGTVYFAIAIAFVAGIVAYTAFRQFTGRTAQISGQWTD